MKIIFHLCTDEILSIFQWSMSNCKETLFKGKYDTAREQAFQFLQRGTRLGVPAEVLHGAWGEEDDGTRRGAGGSR